MDLSWVQIADWRWAYVHAPTDTSVSTVLNEAGKWERHGHEFASLEEAKAGVEAYALSCLDRHGKLPDTSHRG